MKKKSIIVLIVLIIVCLGILGFLFNRPLSLKNKAFTFEYGDTVSIDQTDVFSKNDAKSIQDFKLDDSQIQLEKEKKIPQIGKYRVELTYKHGLLSYTEPLSIEIKDTKVPSFVKFSDVIEIPVGTKDFDFSSYFEAEDQSAVTMEYQTEDIDFETVGEYTMKVQAKDTSDNLAKKNCTVQIVAKEVPVANLNPTTNSENQESSFNGLYVEKGILVINKKHGVPADYAPQEDPIAGAQIRKLIGDMQSQGYDISHSYSGYRSYDYQMSLYNGYVTSYGQAQADRFSARPGFSEHQSGLAFDLKHGSGALVENQREVDWIQQHAHEYGFIVRYPFGKESVTGYMPEPWHLRYIGDEASKIYASGLTLEEYLGIPGGDYN